MMKLLKITLIRIKLIIKYQSSIVTRLLPRATFPASWGKQVLTTNPLKKHNEIHRGGAPVDIKNLYSGEKNNEKNYSFHLHAPRNGCAYGHVHLRMVLDEPRS